MDAGEILFSGMASFIALAIAYKKGFFTIPFKPTQGDLPSFLVVAFAFAIYGFLSIALPGLFLTKITHSIALFRESHVAAAAWLTFGLSGLIVASLALYCLWIPRPVLIGIWRRNVHPNATSDFWIAVIAAVIAFPIVIFMGDILELIVSTLFHEVQIPDQIAVQFLKMTLGQVFYLVLAIVSIVFFAPLIEEILFRGFLQSYLRRYLKPLPSILISSFCFSLLHYSSDQKLANIPILGSLIILACFLGFIYERQKTLRTPIWLHAIFNAVSAFNLYFDGTT